MLFALLFFLPFFFRKFWPRLLALVLFALLLGRCCLWIRGFVLGEQALGLYRLLLGKLSPFDPEFGVLAELALTVTSPEQCCES